MTLARSIALHAAQKPAFPATHEIFGLAEWKLVLQNPAREGRASIQEWLSLLTVTDFEVTVFETGGHGGFVYRRGR